VKRVTTAPTGARGSLRTAIYAVVRRIPCGKVATYGQVAALAGFARHARQVGYALNDLPSGSDVPWHRVVNARGEVSPRAAPGWEEVQKDLLEQEEVCLGPHDRVDLARYGWKPRTRHPRPTQAKAELRRRS
jgi:methylated-DNA-protein-cysteine methyltransferase-like protein